MRPFKFTQITDAANAVKTVSANKDAKFLAGGTNLIDLMKEDVMRPNELVDISRLNLTQIKSVGNAISIGALVKNSDTANHPLIRQNFPLLSQAILSGATAQIRNMATTGGNLLQKSRCLYIYDTAMPCNKREPGTGCSALEGINRNNAIFGWSNACVCVHPSDMCVALAALDAVVKVQTPDGKTRTMNYDEFFKLPEDTPEKDTNLQHGELITSIEVPKRTLPDKSYYLKVRDRASYSFALVSVAAIFGWKGGFINSPRIVMGGVAHKPWRAFEAEKLLGGKEATEANFKAAAEAEMKSAKPLEHNKFKVELGKRAIVRALNMAMNGK